MLLWTGHNPGQIYGAVHFIGLPRCAKKSRWTWAASDPASLPIAPLIAVGPAPNEHPRLKKLTATLLLFLACPAAWAQAPALTHLFPMGARQGTTVTVSLGAKDLPAEAQVRVEGEGITLG